MATDNKNWTVGQGTYKEYRHLAVEDRKYVKQHSNESLSKRPNSFISKWGIHAVELAKQENVHPATIHMRVLNYGSPFQRASKPSPCELIHQKTIYEVSLERNLHPQTIRRLLKTYGDAYHVNYHMVPGPHGVDIRCDGTCNWKKCIHGLITHGNAGLILSDHDWKSEHRTKNKPFWLHPKHPDYPVSRGDKA